MMALSDLSFTSNPTLIFPSKVILTAEVFLDLEFALVVQRFNSLGKVEYLCQIFKKENGKHKIVSDDQYYPEELSPIHEKNNYGSIEVVERCLRRVEELNGIN